MSLEVTSHSLLDLVRTFGRGEDWQRLLEIYQPASVGYFVNRGLQPADAEDLAQDFWEKMARGGLHQYQRDKGRFQNWLFTCLYYALVGHVQRRKAGGQGSGSSDVQQQLEQEPDSYVLFASVCSRNAFEWAKEKARAEFSPRDWDIFVRMDVNKETADTLAEEHQLSPHTIREIRRAVRDKLLGYYLSVE